MHWAQVPLWVTSERSIPAQDVSLTPPLGRCVPQRWKAVASLGLLEPRVTMEATCRTGRMVLASQSLPLSLAPSFPPDPSGALSPMTRMLLLAFPEAIPCPQCRALGGFRPWPWHWSPTWVVSLSDPVRLEDRE